MSLFNLILPEEPVELLITLFTFITVYSTFWATVFYYLARPDSKTQADEETT